MTVYTISTGKRTTLWGGYDITNGFTDEFKNMIEIGELFSKQGIKISNEELQAMCIHNVRDVSEVMQLAIRDVKKACNLSIWEASQLIITIMKLYFSLRESNDGSHLPFQDVSLSHPGNADLKRNSQ